jgi:hypothetical protein
MSKRLVVISVGIAGLVGTVIATPGDARIACKKGFQIVDGQWLATPYCQDIYLAQVAREYGTRVSDREILYNPNRKREVCRFVGQDIRVKQNCETILPKRGPL